MKRISVMMLIGAGCVQMATADVVVFQADFESGTTATTGTITYTAGYNVTNAVTGGPDATLGNRVLFADPSTGGSAATDITLTPVNAVSLSAGQAAKVSLDFVIRRTNGATKSHYVTGYDSNNNIIFQFVLGELNEFGNGGADRQRPGYADSSGSHSFTAGQIASGTNPGSYWFGNDGSTADGLNAAKDAHFEITVSSGGWSLYTVKLDGTEAQTITLPTWDGGTYSELAYVKVTGESAAAGGFFDNFTIQSVAGPVIVPDSHDFYHNLAKYQSVTADSFASDNPVQFATDGFVSQDSRWVSTENGPHWLEIELAAPMTIGSAHLFSGGASDAAMADLVLQYDNGGSWVDIAGTDVSGNTLPNLNLAFDAPVTAQTFRLYTTDAAASVKELALYPPTSDGSNVMFGVDVDLNIAKQRQYDYSSVDGVHYPRLAIDGYADNASAWASTDGAGPHDLEIHLPQGENIRGIQLYSGYEDAPGTQIQNFEVAYQDGGSWVLFNGGSVSSNTALDLNLWFGAAATATKIRIRSLDSSQAVIRELVVLPENNAGGYPLWTDVLDEAPPAQSYMDYEDSYYTIENRDNGLSLSSSTNGSFTTADAPQFQVLLNIGTDTYRLRSKDSGNCFEVAMASTNTGAAIVEGDYSSMPHQRWQLVDTGDGEHFKIVNAWSGMVLGLDGTNVVQQADGSGFSKHWKINYETHFPKQGEAAHFHFSSMFKPSWVYDWRNQPKVPVDYPHEPMQWGGAGASNLDILKYQSEWSGRARETTVMGFNEPDLHDQANIATNVAAYQWPRLERMRLPLLGPCPAGYKNYWRTGYEDIAEKEGLRSEYMAMHWYSTAGASGGSPGTLISNMEYLYNLYGKPIWLTEFSTRNFNGTMTSWSRNHNYNFLAEFAWRAETLPWLKRWSLFEWGYGGDPATTDANSENPTDMNSPKLALHYSNDSGDPGWEDLMECGLLLAGWDGNTNTLDNTSYIIHNKGRFLRLIDHPASNTVTYADVENRSATEQFMLEAAPNGNKYITGLSDGRRLSYNGSSVGLAARGTTGASVEWTLTDYQYGWVYIDHPSSGKRLRITDANEINVDAGTASHDNVRFRFIKHYNPITLTEVQTLPYRESFENGVGAWREFDTEYNNGKVRFWEIGTGGTPTAAAGPSGAADGNYYLFSEGHDAGSYVTNMVECSFDFSTAPSVFLGFDYHMYGSYIAFLALDVFDGSTWTSDVWKKSNQQHSSRDQAWTKAAVDLSAYAGNSNVKLRFRTANKLYNAADPAIDNIRIDESNPGSPVASPLSFVIDEDTAVAVTLSGSDPDGDMLSYKVTSQPSSGTLSGTAPDLTYTPGGDFYGSDSFTYTVNDGLAESAQVTVSITVNPIVMSLPYAESFEMGMGGWQQVAADDYDWTLRSGGTPTAAAGPSGASDGEWYLYAEGHHGLGSNKTASVMARFDFSAVSTPELTFDYHMYGNYIDYLALDVFDGSSWTLNVWRKDGKQHASSSTPWSSAEVDLSAYAGTGVLTLRFRTANLQWNSADPAIDNIVIVDNMISPYDQWAEDAFSGAPGGTDTSATGNPDGDSNNNNLEWILATDPMVSDSPITAMWFDDPTWYITYTRRVIDGISVYAEYSPELTDPGWDTTGFTEVVIGSAGDVETVAVFLPYDLDEKFIRLRVDQ
ncbi:glycosyl hydrolase [Pontiellaceae bacterium B12227]|nr:glycosyl hydrolase [Pontiellaceae bacterium B12227]